MPGVRVENGQDVLAVYEAVSEAVERARRGDGPTLIEVMTYRLREHAEGLRLKVDYRRILTLKVEEKPGDPQYPLCYQGTTTLTSDIS